MASSFHSAVRSPSPRPRSRPSTPVLTGFLGRSDHVLSTHSHHHDHPHNHDHHHENHHGHTHDHHPDHRPDHRPDDDRSLHSTGSFRLNESDDDLNARPATIPTVTVSDTTSSTFQNVHTQNRHYCTPHMEDRMRRRLKFFFMNPWQKWRARHRFPWKLLLQVSKVILVMIQLCIFGSSRSSHVSFLEKSRIAFKHLFLCEWDASYETLPYPPATGSYAIYTIPKFYEYVNYTIDRYSDVERIAIGTYHFDRYNDSAPPIQMCKKHYKVGQIFAFNQSYHFDSEIVDECFDIPSYQEAGPYDIKQFLEDNNRSMNFDRLINVELRFDLKTVHLKGLSKSSQPDCFEFHIVIRFENTEHNGQMLINLFLTETPLECKGYIKFKSTDHTFSLLNMGFDGLVILVSICSMVLCIRSIYRAQKLRVRTEKFFKNHMSKKLNKYDLFEFVDFWYILIIINDVMTIVGSIYKIEIENEINFNAKKNDMYEMCSMFLGTGSLLVWFGMLRYFGFFEKYNILILTLKRCAPNVMRFVVVAGVFYVGFCFCGWVVLGPYHIKFRSLSTASECLFSLVNGDDMFVTFSVINDNTSYVWIYSRIYLYSFISLFIYVVLSVFISVIMDTYETIKNYYEHGFPLSDLMEFVDQCTDDCDSPLYRTDESEDQDCCSCYTCATCSCWPGCRRRRDSEVTEYTNIIS